MSFRLIIFAGSAMVLAALPVMAEPARNIAAEATATCMTNPDNPPETICACWGASLAEIVHDPDLYDRLQGKPGASGKTGLTQEEQAAFSEPLAIALGKCSMLAYLNDPESLLEEEEDEDLYLYAY